MVIIVIFVIAVAKGLSKGTASSGAQPSGGRTDDPYAFFEQKYSKMREQGLKAYPDSARARAIGSPYPWATEGEENEMFSDPSARGGFAARGDVAGILNLLVVYKNGRYEAANDHDRTVFRDDSKLAYWRSYLINGAARGDRECQAALAAAEKWMKSAPNDVAWASPEECAEWKQRYEGALLRDAENGDPAAQYAVARVQLGDATYLSDKRFSYFVAAGESGLGDGYYLCAQEYDGRKYRETGEAARYYDSPCCSVYFDYIQKCADLNNGAYCGVAQFKIANLYKDGEAGREKNIAKARYYYGLAEKNGFLKATDALKYLYLYARN